MRPQLIALVLCVATVAESAGSESPLARSGLDCVVLDNPLSGGGEIFEIGRPGRYCLGKNMSTRLDLPDRREQSFLISIRADNVDLDLRGHTLDRGWNRKSPGKPGIEIVEPVGKRLSDPGARNITIRNGTLRGFGSGVAGILDCRRIDCKDTKITYDATSDTYFYAPDNITVKNVKFKDVKYKIYFSDGRGNSVAIAGDSR